MSEMEKLADAIDPRKHPVPTIEPPAWNWRPRHDDLIAASNTLRQHATALEIGRGIGREEAAKEVDSWATTFGSQRIASAIRAASQALDVEGMVEQVGSVIDSTYSIDIGYHEIDNTEAIARAVLASLGIKNG